MKDTYKEPITLNFPNMVVRVHRPELTQTERSSRMKKIELATANLLQSERTRK
jgi:hypothetical protein